MEGKTWHISTCIRLSDGTNLEEDSYIDISGIAHVVIIKANGFSYFD